MSQELPEGYESPTCEPATLRNGETTDEATHAQRNLEQIRMLERAAEEHGLTEDDD